VTENVEALRTQFSEFHETHFSAIFAYALRRTVNRDDACDLCAEVFLVAWRRFGDIPSGQQGRLWLFGVARRTLGNHRRAGQRQTLLAAKIARQRVSVADTDSSSPDDALAVALGQLRDDDRELLTLIAWDELSPQEAAAVIGISAATARVRLHRAKARLKQALVLLEPHNERVWPPPRPTFAQQRSHSSEMDI
jgi:RNA polymerase sigma factor (sigma-70 family)